MNEKIKKKNFANYEKSRPGGFNPLGTPQDPTFWVSGVETSREEKVPNTDACRVFGVERLRGEDENICPRREHFGAPREDFSSLTETLTLTPNFIYKT